FDADASPRKDELRSSPHHARTEAGPAPRRLDFLFPETVRVPADIAGPREGPGATPVIGGAGGLAGSVTVAALDVETPVIAARPVDRGLLGKAARLDHAGAAHAGDAAIVLHARRHIALQPAHGADDGIDRIIEAPGMAAAVALA